MKTSRKPEKQQEKVVEKNDRKRVPSSPIVELDESEDENIPPKPKKRPSNHYKVRSQEEFLYTCIFAKL